MEGKRKIKRVPQWFRIRGRKKDTKKKKRLEKS